MKRHIAFFAAIPMTALFVLAAPAGQQGDTIYLVHETHTLEECIRVIDKVANESPGLLNVAWWGCESEVHESWWFLAANNERELLNILPEIIHDNLTIVDVSQFKVEQIREWHD